MPICHDSELWYKIEHHLLHECPHRNRLFSHVFGPKGLVRIDPDDSNLIRLRRNICELMSRAGVDAPLSCKHPCIFTGDFELFKVDVLYFLHFSPVSSVMDIATNTMYDKFSLFQFRCSDTIDVISRVDNHRESFARERIFHCMLQNMRQMPFSYASDDPYSSMLFLSEKCLLDINWLYLPEYAYHAQFWTMTDALFKQYQPGVNQEVFDQQLKVYHGVVEELFLWYKSQAEKRWTKVQHMNDGMVSLPSRMIMYPKYVSGHEFMQVETNGLREHRRAEFDFSKYILLPFSCLCVEPVDRQQFLNIKSIKCIENCLKKGEC